MISKVVSKGSPYQKGCYIVDHDIFIQARDRRLACISSLSVGAVAVGFAVLSLSPAAVITAVVRYLFVYLADSDTRTDLFDRHRPLLPSDLWQTM